MDRECIHCTEELTISLEFITFYWSCNKQQLNTRTAPQSQFTKDMSMVAIIGLCPSEGICGTLSMQITTEGIVELIQNFCERGVSNHSTKGAQRQYRRGAAANSLTLL